MNVAQNITDTLLRALGSVGTEGSHASLERPADLKNGDYSAGVALQSAKKLGKNPHDLAQEIVAKLGTIDGVEKIEIAGAGFINFYLAPEALAASLEEARSQDMWGANEMLKGKRIMVEYTDPNPFKEFHIGHLMSNAIGESISRLLQFSGAEVKRANYQGDVGPHVAKAIWGMIRLGINPHDSAELGRAYSFGAQAYESDTSAKADIDSINAKIYEGSDMEINGLYAAGCQTSLRHFEELYKILGTKFDFYFFESETAPRGLELVRKNPKIFVESEGAIVYRGPHTRVFLTSKGLPTYETKELGLAELKWEKWMFDSSITVTAHEQADYFVVVLTAMREVLPEVASKISHISHGMMRFAEGKMSSRTGNVITGESLLNELIEAAKTRASESRADDKEKLAEYIAVGAIKYQVLKQQINKDIIFDRDRALSLDGDSGPYLQYAHARAHQILEKAKEQGVGGKVNANKASDDLSRTLHRFPEIIEYAASLSEPHILTVYLLDVASRFNSWYAQVQILDGSPEQAHKVALADAVRKTLKNGLWVLGIPAPEKM
ncbi:MAG: hypothetical protein RLZZ416_754 [Candidatus Parcubacteria bacterium]|jgi:arginyl-tRNA synthetase